MTQLILTDAGIDPCETLETFPRNPGRGYTPYPWIVCKSDGSTRVLTEKDYTKMGLSTPMYDLSAFSSGNDKTQAGYRSVKENPARVGGVNRDIDDATLAAIESAFAGAKRQGVQLIPRFSYAWDDHVGCEPDELKWILRHIEQLCEVVNRYAGTVISVEGGMMGPWGEMHGSYYVSRDMAAPILRAWLDQLDPNITLQVRNAGYFCDVLGVAVEDFKAMWPLMQDSPVYRMGLYNDGYLGTGVDTGTFDLPSDPETKLLHRESANRFMRDQNQRIPYGGDIAYTSIGWIKGTNEAIIPPSPIYDDSFVKELYDTHLSYLRNIVGGPTVVEELEKIPLEARHAFDGVPDVSAYYGQNLQKFMLDHIGYRYVLRSAKVTERTVRGGCAQFAGTVENVGFGNQLGVMCAELIVVAPDGRADFCDAPIDLRTWRSAGVSEYTLSYAVPDDAPCGQYRAYLRFGSTRFADAAPGACTVRFANADIYFADYGANFIGSFLVG